MMDWMNNRFTADYKVKKRNMMDSIGRLNKLLGYGNKAPVSPATRRHEIDRGTIDLTKGVV